MNTKNKIPNIIDLIPSKNTRWTLIQARIPTELVEEIRPIMKKNKVTWNTLISASLRRYKFEKKGQ